MNMFAITLGFDPTALNWSGVANMPTTRKKRGPAKGTHGRPNKWGLRKGLNAEDHSEYVRQWRRVRKQLTEK